MLVIVNVFGGRDVGKSTIAMHAAAELRWSGVATALTFVGGGPQAWTEDVPDVAMRVFWCNPQTLTPHGAAELCRGALNFLVARRKDYAWGPLRKDVEERRDAALAETLRAGHVDYKEIPGVRASVPYVVLKAREREGFGK